MYSIKEHLTKNLIKARKEDKKLGYFNNKFNSISVSLKKIISPSVELLVMLVTFLFWGTVKQIKQVKVVKFNLF